METRGYPILFSFQFFLTHLRVFGVCLWPRALEACLTRPPSTKRSIPWKGRPVLFSGCLQPLFCCGWQHMTSRAKWEGGMREGCCGSPFSELSAQNKEAKEDVATKCALDVIKLNRKCLVKLLCAFLLYWKAKEMFNNKTNKQIYNSNW